MQERCLVENNLRLEVNKPHLLNEQIYFSLGRIAASEINPDFTSSEKKKIAKISIRMKVVFCARHFFPMFALNHGPRLEEEEEVGKNNQPCFFC